MTDLNELFRKVTSMIIDVKSMIETSEDKETVFRHLIWHIPNGVKWRNDPEMSKNIGDLMNALAEACGVNAEEIYNEDNKIDYREELALSSAEVEIVPTEAPTEEITEEPTETPSEDTTEEVKEEIEEDKEAE